MDEIREEMHTLMSGYLDDELDAEERARFERYVSETPDFKNELEDMTALTEAATGLSVEPLPDEVWDTFLDNVYYRLERRTGWIIFLLGAAILAGAGIYWFIVMLGVSPTIKVIAALPLCGLGVLFASVLRERLFMLKTDKYSRDIKR